MLTKSDIVCVLKVKFFLAGSATCTDFKTNVTKIKSKRNEFCQLNTSIINLYNDY